MANNELVARLDEAILTSLTGVPLPAPELALFSQRLAQSYLTLTTRRNIAGFTQEQQKPMQQALRDGLPVERLLAAIEIAGALVVASRPTDRVTVSFANAIAKMTVAKAYMTVAGS